MAAAEAGSKKERVFLEGDDEIRGQKYVCLSFISPDKALLRNKEMFMIHKFLNFFALDYKIRATESFVLGELREIQSVLSDVELKLSNGAGAEDKDALLKDLTADVTKIREKLSRRTAEDLEAHVKANMSDFKESTIQEAYERFMVTNRQKLEDEFHKSVDFQTTLLGLKVRGVYATNEQAVARAKALHKKDPYFNVYVADVGEWLPWDPHPEDVQDGEYANDQLNRLMQAYRENAAKRDAFFEEEKRQKMAEAAAAVEKAKKEQAEARGGAGAAATAVFGEKGKEVEAADIARSVMEGIDADLAIARKAGAAATEGSVSVESASGGVAESKGSESGDSIAHA
jgi:hypothetical protein